MMPPCRLNTLLFLFRMAGCTFVLLLGLFAIVDSCNGYTYPLLSWAGMVIAEVVAMAVGLGLSTVALLWHSNKHKFLQEGLTEKTGLIDPATGKPTDKSVVVTAVSQDYLRSVARRAMDFVFFGVLFVTALWLLVQIAFVYLYTKNQDGFQTQLEMGFPTDEAIRYAIYMKLQFLFTVQIQAVMALCICIGGAASSKISKHATA